MPLGKSIRTALFYVALGAPVAGLGFFVLRPIFAMPYGVPSRAEPSAPGEKSPPTQAVDPVCAMDLDVESGTPSAQYRGKTYYFCSTHCAHEFEKNPVGFVKP